MIKITEEQEQILFDYSFNIAVNYSIINNCELNEELILSFSNITYDQLLEMVDDTKIKDTYERKDTIL